MSPSRSRAVWFTLPVLLAVAPALLVFWAVSGDVHVARADLDAHKAALADHENRIRSDHEAVTGMPKDLERITEKINAVADKVGDLIRRVEAIDARQRSSP